MRNAALSLFALALSTICLGAGHDLTTPDIGPSPLFPGSPVITTNGTTFLSVWQMSGKIYGAFFDATGHRISGADIPIMQVRSYPQSFQLVAAEHEYVLFSTDDAGVRMTRIADDGKVRSTNALSGIPKLYSIAAASNGNQFLVAGATDLIFPPSHTVAYLVDSDGSVLGKPYDVADFGRVRLSWGRGVFLIARAKWSGVFLQQVAVDSSGSLPPELQITLADGQPASQIVQTAAAATNGDEIAVVWSETGPRATSFWSAVVSPDGTITKRQVATTGPLSGVATQIVWTGSAYAANVGQFVVQLNPRGEPIAVPTDAGQPIQDLAAIGDVVVGIGGGYPPMSRAMHVVLLNGAQDVWADSLSMTPIMQMTPSVASDGVDFMSAFSEWDPTTFSVTAAAMSRTGDRLRHSSFPSTAYRPIAAIAFGASMYVMVWADTGGLYAERFTTAGDAMDSAPILIRKAPVYGLYAPVIASAGDSFLLVWSEGELVGARMTADGVLSEPKKIDPGLPPHVGPFYDAEPKLAWNGRSFVVVWGLFIRSQFEGPAIRGGTAAIRVATDGTPLDATATIVQLENLVTGPDVWHAAVASDGDGFLIALDGATGLTTVAVTGSGVVGPRQTFFQWFSSTQSDVTFDGTNYVVSWRYSGASNTWLASARARSDGNRLTTVVTEVDVPDVRSPIAVAANGLHEAMSVLSEYPSGSSVSRVRSYFDWEMLPALPRPSPPTNVAATGTPSNFTLTWNLPPGAEGIVVQPNGAAYTFAVIPAMEHSHTFNNTAVSYVTVRAFNAGGMSDPVTTGVWAPPRRRATR